MFGTWDGVYVGTPRADNRVESDEALCRRLLYVGARVPRGAANDQLDAIAEEVGLRRRRGRECDAA